MIYCFERELLGMKRSNLVRVQINKLAPLNAFSLDRHIYNMEMQYINRIKNQRIVLSDD